MKVALELQPCCGNRSGIGTYAYELARRLRDSDGLTFCGNLFNFLGRNDNSVSLAGIGMPIRESRLFPYGVYRRIWTVVPLRYDSLFPGRADLNIFFNYIAPPRVDGKIITTIHDLTYVRYPETVEKRNLRRLKHGMARSLERSDRILTISEFSRREIRELLGYPEEKISVVPCAPSTLRAPQNGEKATDRFGIRKPYILYVGTIEPRKNLVRLIHAFKLLKRENGIPHTLVLAGGRGWADQEIYKAANGAPDVLFTGYVSEEEKSALYKGASVFAFPSLYEGFGIPPLEAMSLGCPVVCANAASLPEVTGGAAELVDHLDEASIAEGIWRVISDEAYAAELVRRGCERAKRYTWDASAEKLTDVCRTVLGLYDA